MQTTTADVGFTGAIPQIYDKLLGPIFFEPYAADLATRVASLRPRAVLEIAAGTGVATRALARALPEGAQLVATDLNQAMLDRAREVGTARPVAWRQADAMALPFADGTFDAVACQFGYMFLPDVRIGFAEARRVLRPGGTLLFSVWDRIEENELADVLTQALAALFPDDPPRFLARTPHGYHDPATLRADVLAVGFKRWPKIVTLPARSRAASAAVPALALCQGTPLRNEIEARRGPGLEAATRAGAEAIAHRFGPGPIDAPMQAHVVAARA